MADRAEIEEALRHIPPTELTYSEWINVGKILKSEGIECSVWDEWSKPDSRYHPGNCEAKWRTFHGSGLTAATLFKYSQQYGNYTVHGDGGILDWDAVITDTGYTAASTAVPHAFGWNPCEQLEKYLLTLFKPDELVSYAPCAFQKEDGKWVPNGDQVTGRKVSDLIEAIHHYNDITFVVGDPIGAAGMWIRFNPVSGKTNDNGKVDDNSITDFRYALVESDAMQIEEQYAAMATMQLPIAALVSSGGKSLHAIVRVDAANKDEYKERVKKLFEACNKYGLKVDNQNSNPSRLSRMPGVMRGEERQELLAVNIGKPSWESWYSWIDDPADTLPDIVDWYSIADDLPDLAPEVIEGILRQGHKMMVSAASKAGKSFLMIELAVRLAEGLDWMGFQCRKSRVLYVNFEIDNRSFFHRVKAVYDALGIKAENHNLNVWNLRGKSQTMSTFTRPLIKRVVNDGRYNVIIIDPIYKVQSGDENNAKDISDFCNALDRICVETGCSAIYVHHHSKGDKTGMRAIDRASGSGVFGRDADAMIDLTEINLSESERERIPGADNNKAFVLSTELREFANVPERYVWFKYPLHPIDNTGALKAHFRTPGTGETDGTARGKAEKMADKRATFMTAYELLTDYLDREPTAAEMARHFDGADGWSQKTVYRFYNDLYQNWRLSHCQNPYICNDNDNDKTNTAQGDRIKTAKTVGLDTSPACATPNPLKETE